MTKLLKTCCYCSLTKSCPALCNPMNCIQHTSLPCPPPSLLKFMSITSVMPSNHLILSHPFLLLPSIFPSIRVFSSGSALHIRWPKYWSFSFIITPSSEYLGLISFKSDWFDLLAVQGPLKCLFRHHNLKASKSKEQNETNFY